MGFRFKTLIFLLLVFLGSSAHAQDEELTGCAADTYNAMMNQAVLQARRENVMNQTFIRKPDSVLMYACFGQIIKNLGDNAGPIFSETDHWKGNTVDISGNSKHYQKKADATTEFSLGESSLDAALSGAAKLAYQDYAENNFKHNYLGGASDISADASSTACDIMQKVWRYAKCENFDDPKVFYTFEELVSEDPRKLPPGSECGETGIKQEVIDRAKGKDVLYDKAEGHMKYILGEKGCNLTVKSGITVSRRTVEGTMQTFPDAFCTNAGCSYLKDSECQ